MKSKNGFLNLPTITTDYNYGTIIRTCCNFLDSFVESACGHAFTCRQRYMFCVRRPFIKKDTLVQVFSCELCGIVKNTFFTEHIRATASGISLINTVMLFLFEEDWEEKKFVIWSAGIFCTKKHSIFSALNFYLSPPVIKEKSFKLCVCMCVCVGG